MFTRIMERKVPEASGETLWNQCLQELTRSNYTGKDIPIEEVDRLAVLVSHQVQGDFQEAIQEVVSDALNGFVDELPF